ncbi:hypothetical protein D9613_009548 [Agrocybe pediades]|uniref:Uncharacterized protein n=1 Tax=Agrocybe pediades TaxID=84607 RepID=A0A8H4VTK4_9AGAR|nr:hypothetical protein D9613_009548 [Agrocybe pediades]
MSMSSAPLYSQDIIDLGHDLSQRPQYTTLTPQSVPWIEAHISLFLTFDILVFLAIISITVYASRGVGLYSLMGVIQRDGIMYFFILLSSNLTWLLLTLYARPALKFLHIEPTVAVTSIMINRITLNLKKAGDRNVQSSWTIRTFDSPAVNWRNVFDQSQYAQGQHTKHGFRHAEDTRISDIRFQYPA